MLDKECRLELVAISAKSIRVISKAPVPDVWIVAIVTGCVKRRELQLPVFLCHIALNAMYWEEQQPIPYLHCL